jgi:hypothetical protein
MGFSVRRWLRLGLALSVLLLLAGFSASVGARPASADSPGSPGADFYDWNHGWGNWWGNNWNSGNNWWGNGWNSGNNWWGNNWWNNGWNWNRWYWPSYPAVSYPVVQPTYAPVLATAGVTQPVVTVNVSPTTSSTSSSFVCQQYNVGRQYGSLADNPYFDQLCHPTNSAAGSGTFAFTGASPTSGQP